MKNFAVDVEFGLGCRTAGWSLGTTPRLGFHCSFAYQAEIGLKSSKNSGESFCTIVAKEPIVNSWCPEAEICQLCLIKISYVQG